MTKPVATLKVRSAYNLNQLMQAAEVLAGTDDPVELHFGWSIIKDLEQGQGVVLETSEGTWIGHVAEEPEEGYNFLFVDLM